MSTLYKAGLVAISVMVCGCAGSQGFAPPVSSYAMVSLGRPLATLPQIDVWFVPADPYAHIIVGNSTIIRGKDYTIAGTDMTITFKRREKDIEVSIAPSGERRSGQVVRFRPSDGRFIED